MVFCKRCLKSNFEVDFNWIPKKKYNKSIMDTFCKECRKAYKNEWARINGRECQKRYREKESTKKYIREFMREWRKTEKGKVCSERNNRNPSEKRKESIRRWRKTDKGIAYAKKCHTSIEAKEYYKKWIKTEKGKTYMKFKNARHRARKYSPCVISISFTKDQWRELLEIFNHKCAYCGKDISIRPTMDHIIPLAKGGFHIKENIVPVCLSCNGKKQDNIWEPKQWVN